MRKDKHRKHTGRTVLIVLLALVLIIGISGFAAFKHFKDFNESFDASNDEQIFVNIPKGASTTTIAKALMDAGLIKDINTFKIKMKLNNLDGKLQAGDYILKPSMTMNELIENLQHGKMTAVKFTIVEGLLLSEVGESLESQKICSASDFYKALEDDYDYWFLDGIASEYTDGLKKISKKGNRLEGFLYPETYYINEGASAHDVIDRMLQGFDEMFNDELKTSMKSSKYSIREIVALASVIEKECNKDEERAKVSSVFYNRMSKGMKLQSDVTIIYALGPKDKFSTDFDSPYNTYKVKGLPIGPICSPSYASIDAALNPEDTDYLYFCLKGDGTGYTRFAKTYEEHLKNVALYRNGK